MFQRFSILQCQNDFDKYKEWRKLQNVIFPKCLSLKQIAVKPYHVTKKI